MTLLRRPMALRQEHGQFANCGTSYAWLCDDSGCLFLSQQSKIPNTVRLETSLINNQVCVALKDVDHLLKKTSDIQNLLYHLRESLSSLDISLDIYIHTTRVCCNWIPISALHVASKASSCFGNLLRTALMSDLVGWSPVGLKRAQVHGSCFCGCFK